MTPTQSALFDKIRSFDIDGGPVRYPFARRLAKENGWTVAYTARAIEEYRRFLFLAAEAGHPVSPSEAVDEVWHLHIIYTESYWTRLCSEVLPRPLHHGPSKGGKAESEKFEDWYARTLGSYRRLFGEEPPIDIWPARNVAAKTQKVNLGEHWVISKRTAKRVALSSLGAAATIAVIAGCDPNQDQPNPGVLLLIFGLVFTFVAIAISSAIRNGKSRMGGSGGTGCSGTIHTSGCSSVDVGGHSHGHSHGHDGGGYGHGDGHGGGHDGGGHDGGSDGGSDSGGGSDGGGDGGGCGSGCGGGCGGGGD